MSVDAKARIQEIVNSYLDKDSNITVDTGIVASHLAQMKLFGIRQGVEFFPGKDNFGAQRKDFIDRVVKYNQIDTHLDSIWDYFLCDGKGIFYIRPTKSNYRIYYFRKHEYRSYYNVDGELEEVVIIYSYQVRRGGSTNDGINMPTLPGAALGQDQGQKRFIRLSIKADIIEETHSES